MDMMGSMMGAAGAVVGAAGQVSAMDTKDQALRYQAQAAKDVANAEALLVGRQQRGQRASVTGQMGGSGVQVNTGTPMMVDEAMVQEIALNEANIRHGGRVEAHALNTERRMARQASRISIQTSMISGGQSAFQGLADSGYFGGSKTA